MNWALEPLTNKPSIYARDKAEQIDQPRQPSSTFKPDSYLGKYEDLGNWIGATARGGIAGGVEGLGDLASGMTSPLSIAASLIGAPWASRLANAGKGAVAGASGLSKAIGPTMDLIENPGVRQVAGSMDDVGSLIGDMSRNLARVPKAGTRVVPPGIAPSMLPSELASVGSESLYNAGRVAPKAAKSAEDAIYDIIMRKQAMGR